jgi:glyoxylase-like metal-dependent hydrolase (beta-lactamase superfamily II)
MVDPSKIIASAHRIYGTRMQELWGNVEPVPRDRVQILDGGDIINIAGRRLEVHYTPGHAIHHVVFFDAHSGDLFTGDVAGVRLQSINYVRPPTPPPDLDIEVWSDSIDKLKRLRPDVLYLAHFGPSKNAMEHLEHLRAILFDWGEFILKAMRENKSESEIVEMLAAQTDPDILHTTGDPAAVKRYEIASNYAMSVQGYTRYWQKKHPERLQ